MQKVATRTLRTGNVVQTAGMENADRVRRPGSREVQTRTHLGQIVLLIVLLQERLASKTFRVVALAEQPGKHLAIT